MPIENVNSSKLNSNRDVNDSEERTNDDEEMTVDWHNASPTKISRKRKASEDDYDSLDDFKSPLNDKPFLRKQSVKIVNDKSKVKGKKTRTVGPKPRRKSTEGNQQSIESSFFKAQQISKPSFMCPLCLKSFPDANAQLVHSKSCASKNKVSTKKLLAATELQERQNQERMAIGLPAGPIYQSKNVTVRKKAFNRKELMPHDDDQVNLALALSESCSEAQRKEDYDQALAVAAESNPKVLEMSLSQQKNTLQGFGFMMNKPTVCMEKPKRTKLFAKTVLQTRTQETRDNMLIAKIGEVLVGSEPITQVVKSRDCNVASPDVLLTSRRLRRIFKPGKHLWNIAKSWQKRSSYYVVSLSSFFPLGETEEFDENFEENVNWEDEKTDISQLSGSTQQKAKEDSKDETIVEESPVKEQVSEHLASISDVDQADPIDSKVDNEFVNLLTSSWSKLVNSQKQSDTLIFVKNGKIIHSHSLVLSVRCPKVEEFWTRNADGVYEIKWLDVDFKSAIAFLEFIYCGKILDNNLFQSNFLFEVESLAEKCEIIDLFFYINKKKMELDDCAMKNRTPKEEQQQPGQRLVVDHLKASTSVMDSPDLFEEVDFSINKTVKEKPEKKLVADHLKASTSVMDSPDLFEEVDFSINKTVKEKPEKKLVADHLKASTSVMDSPDLFEGMDYSFNKTLEKSKSEDCNLLVNAVEKDLLERSLSDSKNLDETPKRSSTRFQRFSSFPATKVTDKTSNNKNDISMFLEKIRRDNAKNDSDVGSEDEDLPLIEKKILNPFRVQKFTEVSSIWNQKNWGNPVTPKVEVNSRRSVLGEFENKIRERVKQNSRDFCQINANLPGCSKAVDVLSGKKDDEVKRNVAKEQRNVEMPALEDSEPSFVDSEEDCGEKDESMYSRYRRLHPENSIANYREIVKKLPDDLEEEEQEEEVDTNVNESEMNTSELNQQRVMEISAFDFYDTHLFAESQDNDLSQQSPANSSTESTPIKPETPVNKSNQLSEGSRTSVCKSLNFDDEFRDLNFDDWDVDNSVSMEKEEVQIDLTQSGNEENDEEQENTSSDHIPKLLEGCKVATPSEDEERIDLTQSRGEENSSEQEKNLDSSISDAISKLLAECKELTKNNNAACVIQISDSEDEITFDDKENQFKNDIFPSAASKSISDITPLIGATRLTTKSVSFQQKKSTSFRRTVHQMSSESEDESPAKQPLETSFSSTQSPAVPAQRKSAVRSLQVKSKSEGSFSRHSDDSFGVKARESKDFSLNPLIVNRITNYLQISKEDVGDVEISFDVPVKEDYSKLSIQQLNERLNEFGIKVQSNKNNAIQLLDHLYEQMYPGVPECLFEDAQAGKGGPGADDRFYDAKDDPGTDDHFFDAFEDAQDDPVDDVNVFDNDDNVPGGGCGDDDEDDSDKCSVSNLSVNSDCSDVDSGDIDLAITKKLFKQLLDNDKDIYYKILNYESLPLETIHQQLCQLDMKFKLKNLVNYLNSECISYYIEYPKQWGQRSRKNKINSKKK